MLICSRTYGLGWLNGNGTISSVLRTPVLHNEFWNFWIVCQGIDGRKSHAFAILSVKFDCPRSNEVQCDFLPRGEISASLGGTGRRPWVLDLAIDL